MKKNEILTHVMLGILIIAALVAVVLQLVNEKTNTLEKTYEIITFGVALIALSMTVLQGMYNARTSRELHKITREIHENLIESRESLEILKEKDSHK